VSRASVGPLPSTAPRTGKDADVPVSLWLALLKAHGLLLRSVRNRVPEGLTLPQFDVLAQLQRRAEGMSPGDLTRELLVTAGNVTGIVDRLVRRGLVERRRVPHDGRTRRLLLTPRGRTLVERAIPRHRGEIAWLMARVPDGDLRRLRDLLWSFVSTLESQG
jgi:DNA-binding MarR family transcriptional regulator